MEQDLMRHDLLLVLPEMTLFGLACLTLLFGSFGRHGTADGICAVRAWWLSQISLAATAGLVIASFGGAVDFAFSGSHIQDFLAGMLKLLICLACMVVFLYSRDYFRKHGLVKGEYYVLGLFAALGMLIMVSAHSLLSVYLGLELLSLSMYAMVAMHRDSHTATEAAMKYFVLGAIASGMLLYGMSILYGMTGSLQLAEISQSLSWCCDSKGVPWILLGMIFVIAGIAFKLGLAPFHTWLPDVYHGAPTAVTLFISSAPKLAAFAILIRLLVDGMSPLLHDWQGVLAALAVLSMAIGNIIAIAQSSIKRMLAYSAIAHAGFILLGVIAGTPDGYAGALFYMVIYVLMNMGAFGMLILLGKQGEKEVDALDECKGLAERSPWFAFLLLCLMFSMAGIPPFAGFWAKWFVLTELVADGQIVLAVAAVCFSVIGAYYYLRVVKLMYFDSPVAAGQTVSGTRALRFALSVNGLAVLALGLMPGGLMQLCLRALGG